ncbi:hypothetical protein, partial [Bacteroides caccae]|uniref:hypothetical protein n=1 Tax=Bacteroides caccae TaxID=47678 RepID=UPI0035645D49
IFCKFTLLEPYKQLYYNILIYRTPLKIKEYTMFLPTTPAFSHPFFRKEGKPCGRQCYSVVK